MSQAHNPYSAIPPEELNVEQKTSVTAIIALVLACLSVVLCIVPFVPLIPVVLAILALIFIARSSGRLGGRGLALAALIIALIMSAVQVGAIVLVSKGMSAVSGMVQGPGGDMFRAIEAGDYAGARSKLAPEGAQRLTDADFDRFRAAYQAELGTFVETPQGFMNIIRSYADMGPLMQQFQGQQNILPFPATFQNGKALLVFQLDPGATPPSGGAFPVVNVIVATPAGTKHMLYVDPTGGPTTLPLPGLPGSVTITPGAPVVPPPTQVEPELTPPPTPPAEPAPTEPAPSEPAPSGPR